VSGVRINVVTIFPETMDAVFAIGMLAVAAKKGLVEFRTTVTEAHAMRALSVDVELAPGVDRAAIVDRVAIRLKEALGVSVRVQAVVAGALPRFEMKAKRFVVEV